MPYNPDPGKNILVINDDPAILQLLEDVLHDEGHRVTLDMFQRSTDATLEMIRNQQPDLAIVDFGVRTEAKGRQLVDAMRADSTMRNIPVVICTVPMKHVAMTREYGDSPTIRVLVKPFDIDDVIHAIDTGYQAAAPQPFAWDAPAPGMPGATFLS